MSKKIHVDEKRGLHLPVMLVCIGGLFLTILPTAKAGVVVNSTRFIYLEGSKALPVSLTNTDLHAYLVKTSILENDGKREHQPSKGSTPSFTLLPPLFRLSSQASGQVRVLHTGAALPSDRESLFYLSVTAIPEGKPQQNSVQMAVRSRFKLFYRPSGLTGSAENAYRQLSWQQGAEGLRVTNSSPYYVTLFNLKLNGREIPVPGMVAPFNERILKGCQAGIKCDISWQTINDYGRIMPVIQKRLPQ